MFSAPKSPEEYHIYEVSCDPDHPYFTADITETGNDSAGRAYIVALAFYVIMFMVGLLL